MSAPDPTPHLLESSTDSQPDRGAKSGSRPHSKASRRREKPQLSCNVCRQRKLRCDRLQPYCSSCISRGLRCTYPGNYAAQVLSQTPVVPSVLERLEALERLVKSHVPHCTEKTSQTSSPDAAGGISSGKACEASSPRSMQEWNSERGNMKISPKEQRYTSGEHWAAILERIHDIKECLDEENDTKHSNTVDHTQDNSSDTLPLRRQPSSRAVLLYGGHPPTSRKEILAALPDKGIVDRYISRYFNRVDLVSCTIHGPSFTRQYEEFWADPDPDRSCVSTMWIGLLFGMMCLSIISSDAKDSLLGHEGEEELRERDFYLETLAQCLILGEYTRGGLFTLETFFHYVYIEFITRRDAYTDIWFLLSLEVGLAMRMGYHRDPRHFVDMSPLQAEMRRRVWATVLLSDILISTQMGMPRVVSDKQYDTEEPRNLNDTDFDETTKELPPGRPENEFTTTLGVIARRRAVVALGFASDILDTSRPCSYEDIMQIDRVLDEAEAKVPILLKPKNLAASVTDPPQLIMSRFFIEQMFHKGKLMLHQRFLSIPPENGDPYAYSRNACLEASLGLLRIQNILNEETCGGGQLHIMRWRVTSLLNHQFLTATMILCSSLHYNRIRDQDRRIEVIIALQKSRLVWLRHSNSSQEAKKAAEAVTMVLAKAGENYESSSNFGFQEPVIGPGTLGTPIYNRPSNLSGNPVYMRQLGTPQDPMAFYAAPSEPVGPWNVASDVMMSDQFAQWQGQQTHMGFDFPGTNGNDATLNEWLRMSAQ